MGMMQNHMVTIDFPIGPYDRVKVVSLFYNKKLNNYYIFSDNMYFLS